MNRSLLYCLFSAVLGALAYAAYCGAPPTPVVAADQPSSRLAPDQPAARPAANRLPAPADDDLTAEERVNVAVYEQCNRSVVNIKSKTVRSNNLFNLETESEGGGSGSVLDDKGHILTNFHVIEDAREIEVTLSDGVNYEATIVGKDPSSDIAVLKVNAPRESLHPVTLGDSQKLKVGQRVFAIGNPFGLERTLTTGIISSLDRTLPTRNQHIIKSVIQIDAAINPGNSGGPLLDSHGRLIGMNTAIASATGQSAGVGFAIPVASIMRVAPQLILTGRVVRAEAGITRGMQLENGLLIATMAPGGPAEKAGLRGFRVVEQTRKQGPFVYKTQSIDRSAADLIVAIDGHKVTTKGDFLAIIEDHHPGDEVTLTIIREGKQMTVPLRLAASSD